MGASISVNAFAVEGRTVFITGASRGMGLEAGRQLAAKGANVIIIGRDEKKLVEGVKYINAGSKTKDQRFHHISPDLSNSQEEAVRVIAGATAWSFGSPPDTVWCCAGASHPMLFVDPEVSKFQSLRDSTYFTSVYTAHAALRAWLKPEKETYNEEPPSFKAYTPRHTIFTASFLALYPIAGYAPYNPSKPLCGHSPTIHHKR